MSGAPKSDAAFCLMLAICGGILAPLQILSNAATQTTSTASPIAGESGLVWASAAAQPIRANVDLVLFNVRVLDTSDRTVSGLMRENFNIFEDRKPQQLKYFSSEDAPISIGLILDVSGSMKNKIEGARLAVSQFLGAANPRDDFFLVTFGDRPETLSGFTSDQELLINKVDSAEPQGDTALIDAIHMGLQAMRKATHDRRVLLVISDGGDNRSRYSARDIQREVREEEVQIFCIGIYSADTKRRNVFSSASFCGGCEADRAGRKLLTDLAQTAGGRFFAPKRSEELPDIVNNLGRLMRSVYVLGYTSSNQKRDGKWRRTEVRVTSAVLSKYRVLNRSGYYAPSE